MQYETISPVIDGIKLDSGMKEATALATMVFGYRLLAYISLRRMKIHWIWIHHRIQNLTSNKRNGKVWREWEERVATVTGQRVSDVCYEVVKLKSSRMWHKGNF